MALLSSKEIPEIETRWGPIDFTEIFYNTYRFELASQQHNPETLKETFRQKNDERLNWNEEAFIAQKEKMLGGLETIFPYKASVEDMLASGAGMWMGEADWLVQLGDDLCNHQPSMAHPSHSKRWRSMAALVRDLHLRDIHRPGLNKITFMMDWVQLTAWYLRLMDIELRKKGCPVLDADKRYLRVGW